MADDKDLLALNDSGDVVLDGFKGHATGHIAHNESINYGKAGFYNHYADMYSYNPLARVIVDIYPDEMTREAFDSDGNESSVESFLKGKHYNLTTFIS